LGSPTNRDSSIRVSPAEFDTNYYGAQDIVESGQCNLLGSRELSPVSLGLTISVGSSFLRRRHCRDRVEHSNRMSELMCTFVGISWSAATQPEGGIVHGEFDPQN